MIQYEIENCAACSGSVGERKGSYLLQSFLRNNMLKENGVNLAQLTISATAFGSYHASVLSHRRVSRSAGVIRHQPSFIERNLGATHEHAPPYPALVSSRSLLVRYRRVWLATRERSHLSAPELDLARRELPSLLPAPCFASAFA